MANWYYCRKCELLITKDSKPSSLGCPGGGGRDWQNLAPVGSTNYRCRKCGMLLKAASKPSSLGCPARGGHDWQKL